jgi:hypothetical protein
MQVCLNQQIDVMYHSAEKKESTTMMNERGLRYNVWHK